MAILRTVYDLGRFSKIVPRDVPDFSLHFSDTDAGFGVEIVEAYPSESHARLLNVRNYATKLFAGEPHIHKDDVNRIPVTEVTVTDKDGNVKHERMRVILDEQTPKQKIGDRLAETINAKSEKHATYANDYRHVNLVIYCHEYDGPAPDKQSTLENLLTRNLLKELNSSPFNEVFVTSTCPGADEVYQPLRLLALIEASYLFVHALRDFDGIFNLTDKDQFASIFVRAARAGGIHADYALDGDAPIANYGGVGVRFSDEGIQILDHNDYRSPVPQDLPDSGLDSETLDKILETYIDFRLNNNFLGPISFPAVTNIRDSMNHAER
ncbi:hypothetical protein KUG88_04570 [Rhodococcus rhodochrous]|uniref:hypothetical protein n=1 Tax=Rhodococcus rhodochrous TaxID=1829 RepID=UPI001E2DFC6A|nr:hypothetical protein [Rhodococcus rhodochrous]MCB8909408.1 hypothetical protein [Rhodococcus rhodochrous]